MLEFDIYLYLSDLLHFMIGSRFIHLIRTDSDVFLFMCAQISFFFFFFGSDFLTELSHSVVSDSL